MSLGPWQLAIIAILVLVLFGRGKISEMMGDFGKGIKSFKQGMNEDEKAPSAKDASASSPTGQIEGPAHQAKPASDGLTEDQITKTPDKS